MMPWGGLPGGGVIGLTNGMAFTFRAWRMPISSWDGRINRKAKTQNGVPSPIETTDAISIDETISAVDDLTGTTPGVNADLAETMAVADTVSAVGTFVASIAESSAASDTVSSVVTFLAALTGSIGRNLRDNGCSRLSDRFAGLPSGFDRIDRCG